jgi:drug/metabolite transporter (DMT)-like permease
MRKPHVALSPKCISLIASCAMTMENVTVESRPAAWKTLLAFGIIYFVWGSTFLAIRIGVHEIPPLLFAAMRFGTAGAALLLWPIAKGERMPRGKEWLTLTVLAALIFLCDYGLLFWAEQRVPSGIAAVMLATIPAFMALSEIIFLRTQKLTIRLGVALLIGVGGVAVLMSRSLNLGGAAIDTKGALALLGASVTWSIASAFPKMMAVPESKVVSSAMQMLIGGLMLTVAAGGAGEFARFHPTEVSHAVWWALSYLIVAGSIIGFTAYVWLLHHESPTKVGTYAYVNPVVAVIIGYCLGGEPLDARIVLGAAFVLVSVVVITTSQVKKPEAVAAVAAKDAA